MELNKLFKAKASSRGPINIALIKYWGKKDETNIIPLNNSLSLTLDMDRHRTETTIEIIEQYSELGKEDEITLIINGNKSEPSARIKKIISLFKSISPIIDIQKKKLNITITSTNTFPMACGCASSASSMSCLVVALNKVFETNLSKGDLSEYARVGSGSACRSIFGGIVEWEKGDELKSKAVKLYKRTYWDLRACLIIISSKQKDISSSIGMEQSVKTSDLLKYRVEYIVPKRIVEMKEAIAKKDFETLALLIIRDSNNFHAICRDTYPTINYLNEGSEYVMKCVHELNSYYHKMICAYTFDAGANAFLIYQQDKEKTVMDWLNEALYNEQSTNDSIQKLINQRKAIQDNTSKQLFSKLELFSLGKGARLVE